MAMCPNCKYIGPPEQCSCQWVLAMVAEGKGCDPEVVKNAETILRARQS